MTDELSFDADPADEAQHEPTDDRFWNESWYFDFVQAGGSLGGYVRVGAYPNLGATWYWACLVGAEDRPVVAVQDHEVPLPRPTGSIELRTEGLWCDHICETPLDHFTVGLEAFAVAVDDPLELYGDARGERVPLGFDLEWETVGQLVFAYPLASRYEISCRVTGEVLVGDRRIEIDGWGQRDHSWGVRDWWSLGWCWIAGRLDDGRFFHASRNHPGDLWAIGYVGSEDGSAEPTADVSVSAVLGPGGVPSDAHVRIGELELAVTPVEWCPVLLRDPDGRVSRFPRGLVRVRTPDGRTGSGWIEFNQPEAAGS